MENEQINVAKIIVNIAESSTELTVQVEQNSVYSHKMNDGTKAMNTAVSEYFKTKQGLLIGEKTSESIRTIVGSAFPQKADLAMEVRGRDVVNNLLQTTSVTETQISKSISGIVEAIMENIKIAIGRIPKEVQSALKNHGIILKGKGAELRDLDKRITAETNLPVVKLT